MYICVCVIFRAIYYKSLSMLNKKQPYTVVRVKEQPDGNILLFLRGGVFEGKFMSLLQVPNEALRAFRVAKQRLEELYGKDATLTLENCGISRFNGGGPIIKIYGMGYTQYLT